MSTPFTYLIGWSSKKRYYYGSRYCKKCHPSDLFTTYFTSSKTVKDFIEENGLPDIIQVRKIFKSDTDALTFEHKVLRRLDVKNRIDFLNKTDGRDWKQTSEGLSWIRNHPKAAKATKARYIKPDEELPEGWSYGFLAPSEKQRQITKERMKTYRHSDETKKKIGESQKGEKNHRYGKKYTEDELKKLRSCVKKGKDNPSFQGYWIVPHGVFDSKSKAVDNSPYHIGLDTIIKWCRSMNTTQVTKRHISRSRYLQNMFCPKDILGKTFEEIGFSFEPVS